MPTPEWLAEQFEEHRAHLRAVAYRMLGSASEAEDAVQESWIRLGRTDVSAVENLRAWLTTVVARVCLDMLRTRTSRREAPLDEHAVHVPDPVITEQKTSRVPVPQHIPVRPIGLVGHDRIPSPGSCPPPRAQ
jgi:RNA polymerase sigma factor (sigma-70 family)